jgi:integrase
VLPVDAVATDDILRVLQPIWLKTPDAASKVRGYIEAVLDAAKAKGFRSGENPALWRGHLDHLLPRQPKLSRGHHAALPFREMPEFMKALRKRDAPAARALEFVILTAGRSGEIMGATWGEIDLEQRVWTVPAARMKSAREHRVPLSERAFEILTEMAAMGREAHAPLFPGGGAGGRLSAMAFTMLLRRMGRDDLTTHGFRSTFRDWAGESTNFPREVAEAALAHTVGDDVERAYRRGDALQKRRKLMDAWARHCAPKAEGGAEEESAQVSAAYPQTLGPD